MSSLAAPGAVSLAAMARTVGAWRWAEATLFEILGAWSTDAPEDDVAVMFAEHSRHHAWRADRWAEVLPTAYVPVAGVTPEAPADAELVVALQVFERTGERLGAAYGQLLPLLADSYHASATQLNPVADRHVLRALRIVEADLRHDLEAARRPPGIHNGGMSDPVPSSPVGEYARKLQVRAAVDRDLSVVLPRWGS